MSILRALGLISSPPNSGPQRDNRQKWLMLLVAGIGLLMYWWWVSPDSATTPSPTREASSSAASEPTTQASAPNTSAAPSDDAASDPGILSVGVDELPPEAATTLALIDDDGPFPYPDKDGSTFGNYEGLLPARERGYYREYTVPTPGESDRGARRIITGSGGEFYWTDDHYETFWRIER